ncbi:hypothetical protein RSSM_02912 [Rhodopirellula sallentina SM41]|uniref:Uncharacterized protein n=1 Tax=Rhodopirellula sallentina SM41 TaxID=1263870 RepID=M5U2D9_9BACT|nr:hypothetical protein RSSM_02912 [Rhodopirellula sallentina SM41]
MLDRLCDTIPPADGFASFMGSNRRCNLDSSRLIVQTPAQRTLPCRQTAATRPPLNKIY